MKNSIIFEDKDGPVGFPIGINFDSIKQFDCRVVHLERQTGGFWMTVLPISPKTYRENNPTKASVQIKEHEEYTTFLITCDWGDKYKMTIPNEFKEEIENGKQGARDLGLL
jgi:hypothetical protein